MRCNISSLTGQLVVPQHKKGSTVREGTEVNERIRDSEGADTV
jgi:hypothetical protein